MVGMPRQATRDGIAPALNLAAPSLAPLESVQARYAILLRSPSTTRRGYPVARLRQQQ